MKRMRYVVGGALVLGIAAGIWLGDLFKGIGTGDGIGIGQSGFSGVTTGLTSGSADLGVSSENSSDVVPESLRVIIKDREYYLRSGDDETPIDLNALVGMVQSASGDDDGIKLRIYRTGSARVTAMLQLRDALKASGVAEGAIYSSPDLLD